MEVRQGQTPALHEDSRHQPAGPRITIATLYSSSWPRTFLLTERKTAQGNVPLRHVIKVPYLEIMEEALRCDVYVLCARHLIPKPRVPGLWYAINLLCWDAPRSPAG